MDTVTVKDLMNRSVWVNNIRITVEIAHEGNTSRYKSTFTWIDKLPQEELDKQISKLLKDTGRCIKDKLKS